MNSESTQSAEMPETDAGLMPDPAELSTIHGGARSA
jgi:hypothetical protein